MKKFNGAKVTELREQKGWTKTYLGKLLDVSQQSITDVEYNRNKCEPTREFQQKIATLFEKPISYFFSEENEINYNFKPSGSKNNSPFRKKIQFGIENFLHSIADKNIIVETEVIGVSNSRMCAWSFLDLYGDKKIHEIGTEIEKEVTYCYRNNELIEKDEKLQSVIVLYLKLRNTIWEKQ